MQVQPLGDRVLVRRSEGKEMSAGGIFLSPEAREKPGDGVVVAVGPGRLQPQFVYVDVGELTPESTAHFVQKVRDEIRGSALVPPSVKVGDQILFSAFAGTPLELDEVRMVDGAERRVKVQHVLLRDEDIVAIVTPGEGDSIAVMPPAGPSER